MFMATQVRPVLRVAYDDIWVLNEHFRSDRVFAADEVIFAVINKSRYGDLMEMLATAEVLKVFLARLSKVAVVDLLFDVGNRENFRINILLQVESHLLFVFLNEVCHALGPNPLLRLLQHVPIDKSEPAGAQIHHGTPDVERRLHEDGRLHFRLEFLVLEGQGESSPVATQAIGYNEEFSTALAAVIRMQLIDDIIENLVFRSTDELVVVHLTAVKATVQDDHWLVALFPSVFARVLHIALGAKTSRTKENH